MDDDSRESGIAQAISADELSFLLNDEIADVPKADNTHKAGTGRPKVSSKRHENAKSLDGMANGDNVFSQEDIDALFS